MLGYHGTTMDALLSIMEKGQIWNMHSEELWTCSECGVYFWNPEQLDGESEAIIMASGNASVGIPTAKYSRRVVLEVDLTDLEVFDDYSCKNMEGAIVHYGPISVDRIRRIWVDDEDLSFYKIHILASLVDMPLYNIPAEIPEHVVEIAQNTEPCFWEDWSELQEMKGLNDEELIKLIASL